MTCRSGALAAISGPLHPSRYWVDRGEGAAPTAQKLQVSKWMRFTGIVVVDYPPEELEQELSIALPQ